MWDSYLTFTMEGIPDHVHLQVDCLPQQPKGLMGRLSYHMTFSGESHKPKYCK